jgi:hypothetical protein
MRNKRATIALLDRGVVHNRKNSSNRLLGGYGALEVRCILDKFLNKNSYLFDIFG